MEVTSLTEAKNAILQANRILAVAHRKPDGDTLGAVCALRLALPKLQKKVDIACVDEASPRFSLIPGVDELLHEFDYDSYDLIIVCDAGDKKMTNFERIYAEFLSNRVPILNIDHHASNDHFGTYNLVDSGAASATILVFHLLRALAVPLDADIATCLMAGIMNDTGGFMHSNTNVDVFRVSAELMRHSVPLDHIARRMFKETPVTQLRLWGRALSSLKRNKDGALVSILGPHDFAAAGAAFGDTGGIIDFMTSVPSAAYTFLLSDSGDGHIKGSFRTRRDDVDVAALAGEFGGGGHRKAAGFTMAGSLECETVWKIKTSGRGNDFQDSGSMLQLTRN